MKFETKYDKYSLKFCDNINKTQKLIMVQFYIKYKKLRTCTLLFTASGQ